jgi:hypothetical protein
MFRKINLVTKLMGIFLSRFTCRTPPSPLMVYLEVTRRCNLGCRMCDVKNNYPPKSQELTSDEIERLISQLADQGVELIDFSGGEPLLREDIFDMIRFANERKMSTHLVSNGTLITRVLARKIVDSGLNAISISVDSIIPEIHNRIRGESYAFERAIKGIKNLVRESNNGLKIFTQTVISRENLHKLDSIPDLAKSLGVDGVRFQATHPSICGGPESKRDHKNREIFNRKELDRLNLSIEKILEKSKKYNLYTNSEIYLKGVKNFFQGKSSFIPCFASFLFCEIDTFGNVYPCFMMQSFGNVKKNDFKSVWTSKKARALRKLIISRECPRCWMSCYMDPSIKCGFNLRSALDGFKSDLKLFFSNHHS